jgi:hypothetical protein
VANFVGPGWFATYGTALKEGRDFDARDTANGAPAVIVNEAFVRTYFPGGQAVGRIVTHRSGPEGEAARTVVGVAADAVFRSARMVPGAASLTLRESVPPMIFVPLPQSAALQTPGSTGVSLSIRSADGSPEALVKSAGVAIAAIDPGVTFSFRSLASDVSAALAQERMVALLSGFFGGLALLLAGLGLYGVISYSVNRRRAEIGIRLALGAARGAVLRLVLGRVAVLVGAGIAAGTALSLWLSRFVAALLFGVAPHDPITVLVSAAVLVAVGGLAAWVPVSRAARIDPAEVLRQG